MRKYFQRRFYSKRSRRTSIQDVSPWKLLDIYVQGVASTIGFDTLSDFYASVRHESVTHLFQSISNLESLLQQYRGSDLSFVYSARELCSLLKKYPFESTDMPLPPRDQALAKFHECEDACLKTNEFLRSHTGGYPSWVHRAQNLIRSVLGDLSPSLIMSIISDGSHGPGSTLSNYGKRVTEYYKYSDFPYTVTKSASMYALAAISANPRWMDILEGSGRRKDIPTPGTPQYQKELQIFWSCTDVADSDSITFVPKDAKTERPIAVGASLNTFLQLGVKSYMERRLKKVGIDLTTQEVNQERARLGSLQDNSSSFVTIDLSSASDTISYELVKLLLDPFWFAFLDDLRHKSGKLDDGTVIHYQKFSAMGNGFTFPLESLIFWAICKASIEESGLQCNRNDIVVFGDDIILRKHSYPVAISALKWSGFTTNVEKSFFDGPFRESCGKDYYSGTDVRPIYLKRRLLRYEDIYYLLNRISSTMITRNRFDPGLQGIYAYLFGLLDTRLINYLPMDDNSDGGIQVPLRYLRTPGINPWLTEEEALALGCNYPGAPTCYYTVSTYSPRIFSGKGHIKLLLALREDIGLPFYMKDVLSSDRPSGVSVTRRNSLTEAVRVRFTSAWNGPYTYHQLTLHPLLNVG
nr:MAG: hypothetical protein 3 [Leviviridae sp.]